MLKRLAVLLISNAVLIIVASAAPAQIVVEEASVTWERSLDIISLTDIFPRITVEYATMLTEKELLFPADLIDSTTTVRPRIVVEYASVIFQYGILSPPCKGDFDGDGDVDGSDVFVLINQTDKLPLFLFSFCYGNTNLQE